MKLSLTPPRLMFLFLKTEHLWNHLPFNANFCVVTNMETKSLVRSVTVIVWLEFDPFMNICRLSDHAEKSYNSFFWQAVLKVQRIGGLFLSEICCDVYLFFCLFSSFFACNAKWITSYLVKCNLGLGNIGIVRSSSPSLAAQVVVYVLEDLKSIVWKQILVFFIIVWLVNGCR